MARAQFVPRLVADADASREFLAFFGRIAPETHPDRAARIAIASGLPLKLAGRVEPRDAGYFHDVMLPLLEHPLIEYASAVEPAERLAVLKRAKALLCPAERTDAFDEAIADAMACGTPVIAWLKPAALRFVTEGETGFLVESEREAVLALRYLAALDPDLIRRAADHLPAIGRSGRAARLTASVIAAGARA